VMVVSDMAFLRCGECDFRVRRILAREIEGRGHRHGMLRWQFNITENVRAEFVSCETGS